MIKDLDKIGFVFLCLAFIFGGFFITCENKQSERVEKISVEEQKLLDSIEKIREKGDDSIVLYYDCFDSNGQAISGGVVYKSEYESVMK